MREALEETPGHKCQGVSKPRSWDQRGLGGHESTRQRPPGAGGVREQCAWGQAAALGAKSLLESRYPSLLSPQPPQWSSRTWSLAAQRRAGLGGFEAPETTPLGGGLPRCNGMGLTFLVSESKGSGVGVLAFWASSGGGASTRGSPKGRAAAKFIRGYIPFLGGAGQGWLGSRAWQPLFPNLMPALT